MSKYDRLREEVQGDPLTRGFSAMTDQEALDRNAIADRSRPVSIAALRDYLREHFHSTTAKPLAVQLRDSTSDAGYVARDLLADPDKGSVNVLSASAQGFMTALVAEDVLEQTHRDDIEGMAKISRWQEIGLGGWVTVEAIAAARTV